jgi:uncharacterized protein (TIGR00730 family)
MKRICVFCGSHAGRDESYTRVARDAAERIVAAGYGIVYGGGSIGLMRVVADAGMACGGNVVGVIPEALTHSEIAHRGLSELHVVGSMHERKALMAELSDAFVALPGGYGTMDEFCEMLTWRQLRIHEKPVGLVNHRGYYDSLLALFDTMAREGFLDEHTRRLFAVAPTTEELLKKMRLLE